MTCCYRLVTDLLHVVAVVAYICRIWDCLRRLDLIIKIDNRLNYCCCWCVFQHICLAVWPSDMCWPWSFGIKRCCSCVARSDFEALQDRHCGAPIKTCGDCVGICGKEWDSQGETALHQAVKQARPPVAWLAIFVAAVKITQDQWRSVKHWIHCNLSLHSDRTLVVLIILGYQHYLTLLRSTWT
jgi:hypothetical protein